MATYFAATPDQDAVQLARTPPYDDETIRTALPPDSDAMKELVTLIYGQAWGDLDETQQYALVETPENQVLTYFGEGLRDTVADLDAGVFDDLAQPWSTSDAFAGLTIDPVDFLTDLQHLCRHARATGADVYGAEDL